MDFKGSYVAIVTPFRDGKFDEAAYAKLIEFQIENGTGGIVPCGTTGESATLSHEEHDAVIRACVKTVAGRVPVMAGTGSNATHEAIRLTREAKDAGADAALMITPYYNKPTQEGLYQHYKAVAEAVEIPIFVYNCPGRTGVSIAPSTLERLAKLKNIVGVKDATGNPDWTTEVAKSTNLTILSGDDTLTLPFMSVGAVGVISVTANIMPRAVADVCKHALANDWAAARKVHEKIYDLTKLLFIESNPIPIKTATAMMGLTSYELRLPLCAMAEKNRELLRAEMVKLGLLS